MGVFENDVVRVTKRKLRFELRHNRKKKVLLPGISSLTMQVYSDPQIQAFFEFSLT